MERATAEGREKEMHGVHEEEWRVSVRPTRLGLGVFGNETFQADEEIAEIRGEVIEDPDYESDYCMDLGDGVLEPDPPFRFLNHSCDPNCELILLEEESEEDGTLGRSMRLYALRDIAVGEELTLDYAWELEDQVRCECGSRQCRGWISAAEPDRDPRENFLL